MKRSIISIAGDLASGKGTVSLLLKEKLNYEIYSNGEYFRRLAKENNMSVTEFNEYIKKHPEIDRQIEKSAGEYVRTHDNVIIDARLGWYVAPFSYKIYLKVDIDEAARRAFLDDKRKSTESFESIEEHKKDLIKRFELENDRYYNLYNVRKDDIKNYDLVVDTTNLTPEEVCNIILDKYSLWKKDKIVNKER